MNKVAASFLAHPDDCEFLCAGTLARLADLGWQIHIITATPGDAGSATERAIDIATTRRDESRDAAAIIHAQYYCLEEFDGYVFHDRPTTQKAVSLLRSIAPGIVFTHAHRDYMTDHESVSKIARIAAFMYSVPNTSTTRIQPGSVSPYLYYCEPLEGRDPLGQPVPPTTYIDIADVIGTKKQMLAAHKSQRDWLRKHHHMDKYINTMQDHAARTGKSVGYKHAEAFVQDRGGGHPNDDILAKLLDGKAPATNDTSFTESQFNG